MCFICRPLGLFCYAYKHAHVGLYKPSLYVYNYAHIIVGLYQFNIF